MPTEAKRRVSSDQEDSARKKPKSDVVDGQKAAKLRHEIAQIALEDLTNDVVCEYTELVYPPFVITSYRISKEIKKHLAGQDIAAAKEALPSGRHLHCDYHSGQLSMGYSVHPANIWEYLTRYKKFTRNDDATGVSMSASPGDYLLVKHDDSDETALLNAQAQWKAQVLEVRALSAEAVYLRVAWLNRPADMAVAEVKGFDESKYGDMELIPTNMLDIIDALTVNGKVQVDRWEDLEEGPKAEQESYYWRHTFDAAVSKRFIPSLESILKRTPRPALADEIHQDVQVTAEKSTTALFTLAQDDKIVDMKNT